MENNSNCIEVSEGVNFVLGCVENLVFACRRICRCQTAQRAHTRNTISGIDVQRVHVVHYSIGLHAHLSGKLLATAVSRVVHCDGCDKRHSEGTRLHARISSSRVFSSTDRASFTSGCTHSEGCDEVQQAPDITVLTVGRQLTAQLSIPNQHIAHLSNERLNDHHT